MGKIGFIFFLLAIAIGYDAVVNDGAYTKNAWAQARQAGSEISARIDREFGDRQPAPVPPAPAERTSSVQ